VESDDDLVFNPYLFRVFEAGKGPRALKAFEEYEEEREIPGGRGLRQELEQETEEGPVTIANYLSYSEAESLSLFYKLLDDNLEYNFKRVRGMHVVWKDAGERYLRLWKDFPRRQGADSATSAPDTDSFSMVNRLMSQSPRSISGTAGAPTQDITNAAGTSREHSLNTQDSYNV
jgi:hypothetical protein